MTVAQGGELPPLVRVRGQRNDEGKQGVTMDGKIIAYSADAGGGILRSIEGRTYYFAASEWDAKRPPAEGMKVSFEPAIGIARAIRETTAAAMLAA